MTFLELTHESGLTSTTLTVDKPEQLTIKNLLDALNIVDSDLVCWIRGPSEEDWVKVLNDQLLQCLLSYYIKFDKFFIVFRHKEQNSPNTTPQLSPVSNKLDNETNIVASQDLPLITTLLENVKEPFTQIPIKESDPSEIMIIENIAVNWTLFPTYVSSKLHDGINLFSIPLKVETKDGELLSIQLTRPTWTRYILRGHKDEFLCALTSADEMLEFFSSICENSMGYENELKKLHSTALFLKIKIFLNDLLIMGDNKDAEMRLHTDQTAIFYLSKVYFDEKEIENILNFPTASGLSVSKLFELSLSQKTDLCASHDLAPLVQEIFGIRKGFQKEKGFTKAFKIFEKDWRQKYKKRSGR